MDFQSFLLWFWSFYYDYVDSDLTQCKNHTLIDINNSLYFILILRCPNYFIIRTVDYFSPIIDSLSLKLWTLLVPNSCLFLQTLSKKKCLTVSSSLSWSSFMSLRDTSKKSSRPLVSGQDEGGDGQEESGHFWRLLAWNKDSHFTSPRFYDTNG